MISRWFYPCDTVQLAQLADMHESDERFRDTFDAFGAGTAAFVVETFRADAH